MVPVIAQLAEEMVISPRPGLKRKIHSTAATAGPRRTAAASAFDKAAAAHHIVDQRGENSEMSRPLTVTGR